MDGFNADLVGGVLLTSLCVIAGKIGMVSSTVASSVLRASPTSYKHNQHRLTLHPITKRVCACEISYLHHGHVFFRGCRLDLTGHLNHCLHQSSHILIDLIVGAVEIGCGWWTNLLRLELVNK